MVKRLDRDVAIDVDLHHGHKLGTIQEHAYGSFASKNVGRFMDLLGVISQLFGKGGRASVIPFTLIAIAIACME